MVCTRCRLCRGGPCARVRRLPLFAGSPIRPWVTANACAGAVRYADLRVMCSMWRLAVFGEMTRASAIPLLVRPRASSRSTSTSRLVSPHGCDLRRREGCPPPAAPSRRPRPGARPAPPRASSVAASSGPNAGRCGRGSSLAWRGGGEDASDGVSESSAGPADSPTVEPLLCWTAVAPRAARSGEAASMRSVRYGCSRPARPRRRSARPPCPRPRWIRRGGRYRAPAPRDYMRHGVAAELELQRHPRPCRPRHGNGRE